MAEKYQPNIIIRQQNRKSLSMRVTPSGDVLVSIPHWVKPSHRDVQKFIEQGLKKLENHIPMEKPQPAHDAETIRAMVFTWAETIGVEINRVQFREMTRKWGSCSGKGTITLNTALFYVPHHLVEYVVVHELVHLMVFDHSPAFWSKLGEYLPDYAERESELNGYRV